MWLTMCALFPPLVVRTLLLIELNLAFRIGDLRGVVLDVAFSFLLVAIALFAIRLARWGRLAAQGVVLAWCVVNFANYEHIRELGSIARLTYVGYVLDQTFFLGSGLASSHPWLLVLAVVLLSISVWASPRPATWREPFAFGFTALFAFAAVAVMPHDRRLSQWRSTHVVAAQVGFWNHTGNSESMFARPRSIAGADLSGRLFINTPKQASNVMLVILEGVSGAYLPIIRDRHGAENVVTMPQLDAIARRGIVWSTFVNHQRQTNRGEYALLCGDYPRLGAGEPKMTELVGRDRLECLPMILRDHGYDTVYLQAAPMSFMMKDQFMPIAGYEVAVGDTYFSRSYRRNHWGVDDRAFLEQSLAMVRQLKGGAKPWFLTLLTVGTHHPFNVPSGFQSEYESGSDAWAMDYLDRAMGAFFREIDAMGVLENTLILITSDESRVQRPQRGDIGSMLAQSWGFLIVLLPSGETMVIDEPFMQLDVPISVLDALGLADPAGRLAGRSLFRRYDDARDLLWGNTHFHLVGGLSAEGGLAVCDWGFDHCVGTELGDQNLFSPTVSLSNLAPSSAGWLLDGVAAAAAIPGETTAQRDVQLINPGALPLNTEAPVQFIAAGQFLSIPAGTQADVEIEMSLAGPPGGSIRLSHDLILGRRQEYLRTANLKVGQTLIIRYSFLSETAFDEVELRVWAEAVAVAGMEIVTRSARIRLAPPTAGDPAYGLTEYETRIENTHG